MQVRTIGCGNRLERREGLDKLQCICSDLGTYLANESHIECTYKSQLPMISRSESIERPNPLE